MNTTEKMAFSVREVQQLLGLGRAGVYRNIKNGTLPSVQIGRRVLVPKKALDQLLEVGTQREVE